jgi:hypothetical protein
MQGRIRSGVEHPRSKSPSESKAQPGQIGEQSCVDGYETYRERDGECTTGVRRTLVARTVSCHNPGVRCVPVTESV